MFSFVREKKGNSNMPDYVSKLRSQVVLLFELEGWEGVEEYAKANGIPVNVCRKLLDKHLLDESEATDTADPENPTGG